MANGSLCGADTVGGDLITGQGPEAVCRFSLRAEPSGHGHTGERRDGPFGQVQPRITHVTSCPFPSTAPCELVTL